MDENKTYSMRSARLWKLFLSTLYISSFTFGGGFVIVTFMKKKFVDECSSVPEPWANPSVRLTAAVSRPK